jgi:hypothetical protein
MHPRKPVTTATTLRYCRPFTPTTPFATPTLRQRNFLYYTPIILGPDVTSSRFARHILHFQPPSLAPGTFPSQGVHVDSPRLYPTLSRIFFQSLIHCTRTSRLRKVREHDLPDFVLPWHDLGQEVDVEWMF